MLKLDWIHGTTQLSHLILQKWTLLEIAGPF